MSHILSWSTTLICICFKKDNFKLYRSIFFSFCSFYQRIWKKKRNQFDSTSYCVAFPFNFFWWKCKQKIFCENYSPVPCQLGRNDFMLQKFLSMRARQQNEFILTNMFTWKAIYYILQFVTIICIGWFKLWNFSVDLKLCRPIENSKLHQFCGRSIFGWATAKTRL